MSPLGNAANLDAKPQYQDDSHASFDLPNLSVVSRSSLFCCDCTKSPPRNGHRGSFKFRNDAWMTTSIQDVDFLNAELLKNKQSEAEQNVSISKLLSRFFPNHPATQLALNGRICNHKQATQRGHPVTVDFSYSSTDKSAGFRSLVKHSDMSNADSKSAASFTLDPFSHETGSAMPTGLQQGAADFATLVLAKPNNNKSKPYKHTSKPALASPELDSDISSTSPLAQSPVADASPNPSNQELLTAPKFVNWPSQLTFEFSSGLCVVRSREIAHSMSDLTHHLERKRPLKEVLIIRRESNNFYEVPKGHLESGETLQIAAERELREETGLLNSVLIQHPLLSEIYTVKAVDGRKIEKTVHYFIAELLACNKACTTGKDIRSIWSTDLCDMCISKAVGLSPGQLNAEGGRRACNCSYELYALFGEREVETKEIRWVTADEASKLFWKSNTLLNVVMSALVQDKSS